MAPRTDDAASKIYTFFGSKVLRTGFMPVPNLLLRHYRKLQISEEELVYLQHLFAITWDIAEPPTTVAALAARMGKSEAAVKRYSQRLRDLDLLDVRPLYRNKAQIGNQYDFAKLFEKLSEFAAPEVEEAVEVGEPYPARPSREGGSKMNPHTH